MLPWWAMMRNVHIIIFARWKSRAWRWFALCLRASSIAMVGLDLF